MIQRRSIASLIPPFVGVGVGVLVLVGWLFDSTLIQSDIAVLRAINPMTAVAFIIAGIALWSAQTHKPVPAIQFAPLIIIAIALLKLADSVFGWNIGIDHLLFTEKLQGDGAPNNMTPITAVALLLLGAAIYLTNRKSTRSSLAAQALTLFAVFIVFLALIGYIYGVSIFNGGVAHTPMAFGAVLTFLVLCASVLSLQPNIGVMALWRSQTAGGALLRRALPASILIIVILGRIEALGVSIGVYDSELGESLFTMLNIGFIGGSVLLSARIMIRSEYERIAMENALRESEARYRSLFENSSDAILIFDEQGRYVDANQQVERLTGFSRDEILTKRVGDFAAHPEASRAAVEEVRRTEQLITDSDLLRKDGSEVAVEVLSRRITPTLTQIIIHDISARKKAEEELRLALEHERQLGELKSRFVSMVSHEFRIPLAVIRSSTDLLLSYGERMDTPKRTERLEKIQQQITRMVRMLNDILEIGKAETLGVEFRPELLDLHEFCAGLVAEVQPATPADRIDFTCSGDCTLVSADPKLLRQAITNLISNAVKYSPVRKLVTLDLTCDETQIVLRVRDEGIGIPEADHERLFEVFHRASNVGVISGTGLGLSIVKQAVDAHGGTIEFASTVNVGTTFTIQLPRRQSI